jgi:serine O-acetyltransferase
MESFGWRNATLLGQALALPALLGFVVSDQKSTIVSDVRRWIKILKLPRRSDAACLLLLIACCQEFRNLYYYRLSRGNGFCNVYRFALRVIYPGRESLMIDSTSKIGKGLFIQHGIGTLISAEIGDWGWINQQVTIGYRDEAGRPTIGDRVQITAGAKVLGRIRLGDQVVVGANAVVVKDVPDRCTVVGVPARIVRRNGRRVDEPL